MPITRGIQCAYCSQIIPNDYVMELHLKEHTDKIKSADRLRRKEDAKRNSKRRNETFSEY
jgi:hypothetical protein